MSAASACDGVNRDESRTGRAESVQTLKRERGRMLGHTVHALVARFQQVRLDRQVELPGDR